MLYKNEFLKGKKKNAAVRKNDFKENFHELIDKRLIKDLIRTDKILEKKFCN